MKGHVAFPRGKHHTKMSLTAESHLILVLSRKIKSATPLDSFHIVNKILEFSDKTPTFSILFAHGTSDICMLH